MEKRRPGWLKNAVATPRGYETPRGELLKAVQLNPIQIAEWNGTEVNVVTDKPVILGQVADVIIEDDVIIKDEVVEEPVVAEVVVEEPVVAEEAVKPKPKAKKKTAKKKTAKK
jgi:hypothetical protein